MRCTCSTVKPEDGSREYRRSSDDVCACLLPAGPADDERVTEPQGRDGDHAPLARRLRDALPHDIAMDLIVTEVRILGCGDATAQDGGAWAGLAGDGGAAR
jgi:hypothetical protein